MESSKPPLEAQSLNEKGRRRENIKKYKSSFERAGKDKTIKKRCHPALKEKLRGKPHKVPSFFLGQAKMTCPFKENELLKKREDLLSRKVDHWPV